MSGNAWQFSGFISCTIFFPTLGLFLYSFVYDKKRKFNCISHFLLQNTLFRKLHTFYYWIFSFHLFVYVCVILLFVSFFLCCHVFNDGILYFEWRMPFPFRFNRSNKCIFKYLPERKTRVSNVFIYSWRMTWIGRNKQSFVKDKSKSAQVAVSFTSGHKKRRVFFSAQCGFFFSSAVSYSKSFVLRY